MLVITSGSATRQYKEGGLPSKMNCNRAVTRSAETMTNPCRHFCARQDIKHLNCTEEGKEREGKGVGKQHKQK